MERTISIDSSLMRAVKSALLRDQCQAIPLPVLIEDLLRKWIGKRYSGEFGHVIPAHKIPIIELEGFVGCICVKNGSLVILESIRQDPVGKIADFYTLPGYVRSMEILREEKKTLADLGVHHMLSHEVSRQLK